MEISTILLENGKDVETIVAVSMKALIEYTFLIFIIYNIMVDVIQML